ncbi:hypothetical protein ASG90_01015 [Nocardioides sp. Soil797]|nr:hypothetical protein ASG90_01015 [Nocardioides sp. Soil797]
MPDQPPAIHTFDVDDLHDDEANALTKRDRIVTSLRRMIASGELPRGSKIKQDALAARFQTSITPVREALRQLQAEGLLTAQPNRGVRVADADYEGVKSVYLQRRLIEPYAMRRAVRRLSPRDLEVAQRLVGEMETASAQNDTKVLDEKNYRFHFLFYENVGNQGLTESIESLWQQFPWDILQALPDRSAKSAEEHRAILEAVRAGDLEVVSQRSEEHIASSFQRLAQHLTGREVPDPFDLDND